MTHSAQQSCFFHSNLGIQRARLHRSASTLVQSDSDDRRWLSVCQLCIQAKPTRIGEDCTQHGAADCCSDENKSAALMAALDNVNMRYGSSVLRSAKLASTP
jgi:hypothetical protein